MFFEELCEIYMNKCITVVLSIESEIEPANDVLKPNILIKLNILKVDHIEIFEIWLEPVILIVDFNGMNLVVDADVRTELELSYLLKNLSQI